ncbi:MAG: pyridoxine 5'-phosphate synthase [bacterium]|nr:pyridoxine 5'-phosphate synthase [bacterium]
MKVLGVNIDHVATLRQARRWIYPSVVLAAKECERAGARQITVHLREDRRHIQDKDLYELKQAVKRLNVELALNKDILRIVKDVKPYSVCFVPERRQEITTEGGLDVVKYSKKLKDCILEFKDIGVKTSIFIEPVEKFIDVAKEVGADAIEIHTGRYANLFLERKHEQELLRIKRACKYAKSVGLEVHVGHGLDVWNLSNIAEIKEVEEFNIGFSIIARALFIGLRKSVKEILKIINA